MSLSRKNKSLLRKIGEMVKYQRMLRGYTQSQTAKELGVSTQRIKDFENGKSNNALILYWYLGSPFDEEN